MESENKPSKQPSNIAIVGINIVVLLFYTLISKAIEGGIFLDAFLIAFHFFGCIIIGLAARKWVWVLSAFVVLLIGFSTCVELMGNQL